MSLRTLMLLGSTLFSVPALASDWTIDSAHSEADFKVRHMGISYVNGSLGTVTGTIHLDDGDIARWTAEHRGYASLDPPATHRRSVLLDRASRSIDIVDEIEGGNHQLCLAFHFGPDVQVELDESSAALRWPVAAAPGAARMELPLGLHWSLHRGETDPILGWYSPGLGRRVPAFSLVGRGRCEGGAPLITRLEFLGPDDSSKAAVSRRNLSWCVPGAESETGPEIEAEAR